MKKLLVLLLLLGVGLVGALYVFRPATATGQPRRDKVDRGDIVEKVGIPGRVVPKGLTYVYTEVPAGRVRELAKEADVGHAVQKTAPLLWLEDDLAQANLKKADGDVELAEAAVAQAKAAKKKALVAVDKAQKDWDYAEAALRFAQKSGATGERLETAQKGFDAANLAKPLAQAQVDEADAGIQTAEAKVRQANAAQDVAQKTLKAMTITAPITGTILQRKVNAGDIITPQTTPILFVIAPNPNDVQIQAQVGEADVIKVLSVMEREAKQNSKAKARIKFDAYADSDREFVGSVVQVAEVPTVPATRPGIPDDLAAALAGQVRYTVTIENIEEVAPDTKEGTPSTRPMRWPLKAGFTANVDLIIHQERDVVRVPSEALNYRPAALSKEEKARIDERRTTDWRPLWIWTADQKAQLVFVKTGISDSGRTQILEVDGGHLEPGTEVVVEGAATNDKMPFSVKVF